MSDGGGWIPDFDRTTEDAPSPEPFYFEVKLPKTATPLESLFHGLKLMPEDIASPDGESWSKALEELVPQERLILECRHGLAGKSRLTLRALGAQLGISDERVRQLQERAHRRLRRRGVARGLIREKAPDRLRWF